MNCVRTLTKLPPRMRACAVLFYWQDLSTAEVARTLKVSERTVKNQLRNARGKLAERLRVAVPKKEA